LSTADTPAVARRRVRIALRNAREARQLTQTQVADAMEWSLSKVMRIEKGEVNVSPTDLRVLLEHLDVTDPDEVRQLLDAARIARSERRIVDPTLKEQLPPGLFQLMQFELAATEIRYYTGAVVPGLMQTPEYASAIFRSYPGDLDEATIAARLDARAQRRERFFGQDEPPRYYAIFDESVLHREIGGPEVMADQLRHLLGLVDNGSIVLRVLPFAAAGPFALFGPYAIVDMGDDQYPILYREGPTGDAIVRAEKEIATHRAWFEQLWKLTYDDAATRTLVARHADALDRERPPG
jgi:transcriptional regulator with XRE-family HTH domain